MWLCMCFSDEAQDSWFWVICSGRNRNGNPSSFYIYHNNVLHTTWDELLYTSHSEMSNGKEVPGAGHGGRFCHFPFFLARNL